MVKLRFLGYYTEVVGARELEVRVGRARVEDVVRLSGVPRDEPIILVNGRPARWCDEVTDADVVVVMPPLGGG